MEDINKDIIRERYLEKTAFQIIEDANNNKSIYEQEILSIIQKHQIKIEEMQDNILAKRLEIILTQMFKQKFIPDKGRKGKLFGSIRRDEYCYEQGEVICREYKHRTWHKIRMFSDDSYYRGRSYILEELGYNMKEIRALQDIASDFSNSIKEQLKELSKVKVTLGKRFSFDFGYTYTDQSYDLIIEEKRSEEFQIITHSNSRREAGIYDIKDKLRQYRNEQYVNENKEVVMKFYAEFDEAITQILKQLSHIHSEYCASFEQSPLIKYEILAAI